MSKTKRERRSEAVKRLKALKRNEHYTDAAITAAIFNLTEKEWFCFTQDVAIDAYIEILSEDECEMHDMWECEDADGNYWQSAWQCTSCGEMVLGVMSNPDTMFAPKYCPNCGEKVRTSHDQD